MINVLEFAEDISGMAFICNKLDFSTKMVYKYLLEVIKN